MEASPLSCRTEKSFRLTGQKSIESRTDWKTRGFVEKRAKLGFFNLGKKEMAGTPEREEL
jgi:hypothetical protein